MSKRNLLILFIPILLLSSCDKYLNRHVMMRVSKDYQYSDFSEFQDTEYRMAPDDVISFRLFANDGFQMINITVTSVSGVAESGVNTNFLIEFDGFAKLPKIGRTYLEGLTLRQAEMLLEDKYSEYYNKPFALLKIVNKRVTIIAGSNSAVVKLENENTTMLEAIASAGGLPVNAIASKVKLIRGNLQDPEVYAIDLSTLEGMKGANMVLQANDIIYIETRPELAARVAQIIAPYLSLLTTAVLIYTLTQRFTPQ